MSHHTLQNIRDFVRGHLDVDETDLTDAVLDVFIREGSKRVERAEKRWPFYEDSWTLNTVAGTSDYTISTAVASDVSEITAIVGPRWPLKWMGQDEADRDFPLNSTSTGEPMYWTEWGGVLRLYPEPNAVYALNLRGYRTAAEWVDDGAGAVPDLPSDLRNCVAQWALSRAYAQQDDPEMAAIYERMFRDELEFFRRRLNDSPPSQPLVLNSHGSGRLRVGSRLMYDWE